MRDVYQDDLLYLRSRLGEIGYRTFSEHPESADFDLHNGWTLRYIGERVGSGGTVLVVPPTRSTSAHPGFALWILMRVFERMTGRNYGLPTIRAQIEFLIQERAMVFMFPADYQVEYDRVNSEFE